MRRRITCHFLAIVVRGDGGEMGVTELVKASGVKVVGVRGPDMRGIAEVHRSVKLYQGNGKSEQWKWYRI